MSETNLKPKRATPPPDFIPPHGAGSARPHHLSYPPKAESPSAMGLKGQSQVVGRRAGVPLAHKSGGGAIGVFDSGIGGLTVVRELLRIMPQEPVVYLGDTARVPYGNKSRETVLKFSTENVLFLLQHDVKLIVIACHTASSFALPFLEKHFNTPILGVIEPGVAMALQATRSGRIGVIGTQATIGSQAYPKAVARQGFKVRMTQAACPLFVPLVEEGLFNDSLTLEAASRYLKPLREARVDTLILGCTHYPLLKQVIGRVMGPQVVLIDSARQVALKAKEALSALKLYAPAGHNGRPPSRQFFVTDEPRHFEKLSLRFLGTRVGDVRKV